MEVNDSLGFMDMGAIILETLFDWEGDVEDLARVAGQWCALLNIEDRPDLTVRLVRDYAQRGILDRPRREGKIAIYGWEHIVHLLAARLLLKDGWPLQKIADEFAILSLSEVRALLPGGRRGQVSAESYLERRRRIDPALNALRDIRSRNPQRTGQEGEKTINPESASNSPPIIERTLLRQELALSRQTLGENERTGDARSLTYTRLEIATGVELHIETARLRSLGRADAHAIAQAILTSLLTPLHRKQDKAE